MEILQKIKYVPFKLSWNFQIQDDIVQCNRIYAYNLLKKILIFLLYKNMP